MAIIQKKIKLVGSKGEREVLAIFDSGASYSCIQPQIARELEFILKLPEPMEFGTAEQKTKLTATERVPLNFYIDGYRFSDEFMLISGLSEPVIIGAKTLQAWRMKLNFETDEVIIDPRVTKLRLLGMIAPGNGTSGTERSGSNYRQMSSSVHLTRASKCAKMHFAGEGR
jgi:hypothetical protein